MRRQQCADSWRSDSWLRASLRHEYEQAACDTAHCDERYDVEREERYARRNDVRLTELNSVAHNIPIVSKWPILVFSPLFEKQQIRL